MQQIPIDPGDVLGDEHLGRAVAVEVTETDVPPGPELRGGELLPQLGPGVLAAQRGEFRLAPGDRSSPLKTVLHLIPARKARVAACSVVKLTLACRAHMALSPLAA